GGEGHDHADGPARKCRGSVLSECRVRRRQREHGRRQESSRSCHASSRRVLLFVPAIVTVARCGGNRLIAALPFKTRRAWASLIAIRRTEQDLRRNRARSRSIAT